MNTNLRLDNIENFRESYNNQTGDIMVMGNIKNLRIKGVDNKVTVIGSLPKFYFGSNLHQLKRKDTELAIEELSDLLNVSLKESKIFRLDIGANIILDEPLQNYFSCLGNLSRFKKSEIANKQTLLYTTYAKSLEFYDKKREMKRSRQFIPRTFIEKYILRYEIHLKQRVQKLFGLQIINAKNLYDYHLFLQGINLWKDLYFSIERVNRLKFNQEEFPMSNARDLKNQLAAMKVKDIGENELLSMIEVNKNQFKHREQYQRSKKLIRELSTSSKLTIPNDAIIELDSKIMQVVEKSAE